jgi:hypothetical protein
MAANNGRATVGRCSRAGLMALALLLNGAAGPQPGAPRSGHDWKIFRDASKGFSFSYPATYTAKTGCHASRNCVAILLGQREVNDYVLAFEVFPGGLEQTATEMAQFQLKSGHWVAIGRMSEHPAERVDGQGWHGLQAVVDCGVSDSSGLHGAGECLRAVLSNDRISVVADTPGNAPITAEIYSIIQSVRLPHR